MTGLREVVAGWERAAQRDDARTAIHPSGFSESDYAASGELAAEEVDRLLFPHRHRRVLDYGAGDGRVARWLTDAYSIGCLDASETMVARCTETVPDADHYHVADPARIGEQIREGAFAAAYSITVLIHQDHAGGEAILRALAHAVEPGGLCIVDAPIYDEEREGDHWCDVTVWTAAMFADAAARAGWSPLELHSSPGSFNYERPGANHAAFQVLRRRLS